MSPTPSVALWCAVAALLASAAAAAVTTAPSTTEAEFRMLVADDAETAVSEFCVTYSLPLRQCGRLLREVDALTAQAGLGRGQEVRVSVQVVHPATAPALSALPLSRMPIGGKVAVPLLLHFMHHRDVLGVDGKFIFPPYVRKVMVVSVAVWVHRAVYCRRFFFCSFLLACLCSLCRSNLCPSPLCHPLLSPDHGVPLCCRMLARTTAK